MIHYVPSALPYVRSKEMPVQRGFLRTDRAQTSYPLPWVALRNNKAFIGISALRQRSCTDGMQLIWTAEMKRQDLPAPV
jgi:hypothetical protein